jgi:hypothetical protein
VRRTRRSSHFPIGTDERHPPGPRNGQRGISSFSAQRLAERVCAAIAQWADDVTLRVMPSSMLTTAVRSQLDRLLHVDEQVDAECRQAAKESGVRQRAAFGSTYHAEPFDGTRRFREDVRVRSSTTTGSQRCAKPCSSRPTSAKVSRATTRSSTIRKCNRRTTPYGTRSEAPGGPRSSNRSIRVSTSMARYRP